MPVKQIQFQTQRRRPRISAAQALADLRFLTAGVNELCTAPID
jgi:hypothetical protein